MLKFLFFSLFLLLRSSFAHNHWWENSKVLELTTQNFYDFVGKSQHVIVEFYAPWCFYCQAMFQQYEELRESYNGANPKRNDVLIAKINGNAHEAIIQTYAIYSYPQIIHFAPGSRDHDSLFQQQRTKDVMSQWIEKICGPEKTEEEPAVEELIKEEIKEETPLKEEKVIDSKENSEERNLERKEENQKMFDILITVADELKFLDKMQKENNEKLIGELGDLKSMVLKENTKDNNSTTVPLGSFNMKHASLFLMLGILIGLGLAFTVIKFRKLNHNITPAKNV